MKTQDIKELDVNKITNEIIDTISSHYEKEIKVLHKALELACEEIPVYLEYDCPNATKNIGCPIDVRSEKFCFECVRLNKREEFIQQAKESIK